MITRRTWFKWLATVLAAFYVPLRPTLANPDQVLTTTYIPLRRWCAADAPIVAHIATGTRLTALKTLPDKQGRRWVQVEWQGQAGWVQAIHLEPY